MANSTQPKKSPVKSPICFSIPDSAVKEPGITPNPFSEPPNLYRNPTAPPPSISQLSELAKRLNYDMNDEELRQCHGLMTGALQALTRLDQFVEPSLPVKYPRIPGYRPAAEENVYNAWYWKTEIKGAENGKLSGKKIVIKDNVMVAGVPMMNGCRALEGIVPDVDATVVTRLLDAGGTILGKSTCENLCYSGCSFTTGYGPVYNYHDRSRSAGGSSSGSAVLLLAGEVDMAIGGDQGGSVRLPSSWNGCVGLKPSWGLVPYTGAMAIEPTVDHLGPMARTVHDCALMLEVIAGYDGLDHRQPPNIHVPEYSKEIEAKDLNGLKVGIIQEGFGHDSSDEVVDRVVREAAQKLTSVGAHVEDVSIPLHKNSPDFWSAIGFEGSYHCMTRGANHGIGFKGFYPSSTMKLTGAALKQDTHRLSDTFKYSMLTGAYLNEVFHGQYYGRGQNLARVLRKAYDDALEKYDVLILPTIPFVAQEVPKTCLSFQDHVVKSLNMAQNTMAFNVTGHPALSINAGYKEMGENKPKLPIGMMIVGKYWDEVTVLKVARAHEKLMPPNV